MSQADQQPVDAVAMIGIAKSFGGVAALEHVDFSVRKGEIHALLGGNGAGKSTVLKMLSGVHKPDKGEIWINGVQLEEHTPEAARRLGIAMIFQEMSLIPSLSVAQNIFLTREPKGAIGLLDDRTALKEAHILLETIGVELDPRRRVDNLSSGQRQLTEIAKALSQKASVLIMDEPTSTLSAAEIGHLFSFLDRLKKSHASIIYVSHRMEEIRRIADRVTVIRNGRNVMTKAVAETTLDSIVEEIVGRRVGAFDRKARTAKPGAEVLRCVNVTSKPRPVEATLTVRAGEIIGIAGLMGSGRTCLAKSIFGLQPVASGEIRLKEKAVKISSPPDAVEAGIAMIPEDRLTQGLVLQHSVADNMTLPVIDRNSRFGFVQEAKEKALVAEYIRQLRVKTASPQKPVRTLSGGNAQKVVLAKWLATDPLLLILDEPTAGVDIGSKTEIVEIVREFADRGRGVLVISSEPAELLALSDRILVMAGGRVVREISSVEIESWAENSTDAAHRISLMETGLQVAIQEANS
ncbi:MAG TPA: sugar ABC transporter ATP-binding protein [Chthoniobacterales bacterium]|nr:sugar ABC transporter ATP-binding protein [Chthoniobacterales bacterium]